MLIPLQENNMEDRCFMVSREFYYNLLLLFNRYKCLEYLYTHNKDLKKCCIEFTRNELRIIMFHDYFKTFLAVGFWQKFCYSFTVYVRQ